MSIEVQGARILGTHVKFFRDGEAFSEPIEGVAGRNYMPGDDDEGWIDFGQVEDSGVELESEANEVWGPDTGKIMLHDIIESKRGFTRSFMAQEFSAFVIEHLYGSAALDELSDDYFALKGATKKGWLLVTRFDQNDVLIVREKAYVHLTITGEVKLSDNIASAAFEARQLQSPAEEIVLDGEVEVVDDLAALLALETTESLALVFIHEPEPGMAKAYYFVWGDETAEDGFLVIAPTDDGGRYFPAL